MKKAISTTKIYLNHKLDGSGQKKLIPILSPENEKYLAM